MRSGNDHIIPNEGAYRSIAQDPPVPEQVRSLTRSAALASDTKRLIPSSSQTFSKGPTQYVQGVAPAFIERGSGSHVWDVDGNEYIDFPMALGAVILGHNYPAVTEAVTKQMRDVGAPLGVTLHDHIIISRSDYSSFKAMGLI